MKILATVAATATILLTAWSGGGYDSGTTGTNIAPPAATTTTIYCHGDFNQVVVHDTNGVETYEVVFRQLDDNPVAATGTRNGNTLLLQTTSGGASLDYDVTISQDGQTIAENVDITMGPTTFIWNESGALGACPTFDIAAQSLPQVVTADFTDVPNDIQDISYFRSAAGHDYSDDFETCRSMKHYVSPPMAKRVNNTVPVFAPFDGVIVHMETEEPNFVDDGVTNQKVIIRSDADPAILAVLFHVDMLNTSFPAESAVTSGTQLGHAKLARNGGAAHDFDIGIHVNTPTGVRYVSYFDVVQDSVFANYAAYAAARSDMIITEQARNADPSTRNGETSRPRAPPRVGYSTCRNRPPQKQAATLDKFEHPLEEPADSFVGSLFSRACHVLKKGVSFVVDDFRLSPSFQRFGGLDPARPAEMSYDQR